MDCDCQFGAFSLESCNGMPYGFTAMFPVMTPPSRRIISLPFTKARMEPYGLELTAKGCALFPSRQDASLITGRKQTDGIAFPDNSIDAITEDSYGTLWLGTVSSGLDRFDRSTVRFTNYDDRNGEGTDCNVSTAWQSGRRANCLSVRTVVRHSTVFLNRNFVP